MHRARLAPPQIAWLEGQRPSSCRSCLVRVGGAADTYGRHAQLCRPSGHRGGAAGRHAGEPLRANAAHLLPTLCVCDPYSWLCVLRRFRGPKALVTVPAGRVIKELLLMKLLQVHAARSSFMFSLGPLNAWSHSTACKHMYFAGFHKALTAGMLHLQTACLIFGCELPTWRTAGIRESKAGCIQLIILPGVSQAARRSSDELAAATLASSPQPPLSAAEQADVRVREAVAALRMAQPQLQPCPPLRVVAATRATPGPPAALVPADALPSLLGALSVAQAEHAPATPERPPPTPAQAAPPSSGAFAAKVQGQAAKQTGGGQVAEGAATLVPAGSAPGPAAVSAGASAEALTPGRRRAEYDMLQQELNKVLSRRHSEAALGALEAQLSSCRMLPRSASGALQFDEHASARADPLRAWQRATLAGKRAEAPAVERSSGGSSSPGGSPLGGGGSLEGGDGEWPHARSGYQHALDTHAEHLGSALQRPQSAPPGALRGLPLWQRPVLHARYKPGVRQCFNTGLGGLRDRVHDDARALGKHGLCFEKARRGCAPGMRGCCSRASVGMRCWP